ncbi:MAG TPA: hypothetical protein VMM77_03135 [Gemmatimonadaceae bacterium]|nr:hypothetical protein [Gemmatimonadaceae bacterium]
MRAPCSSLLLPLIVCSSLVVRSGYAQAPAEELLYDPRTITSGIMVGLSGGFVPGTTVTGERQSEGTEIKTTWGSGIGGHLGYGYTPRLLLLMGIERSSHGSDNAQVVGDITLYHFDFGVRYHFHRRDVRYVPYASLAVGGKQFKTRSFIDTSGVVRRATFNARAINPGGGMQLFFTENFTLDANVIVSIGSVHRIEIHQVQRSTMKSSGGLTTRLRVGVNWYPET